MNRLGMVTSVTDRQTDRQTDRHLKYTYHKIQSGRTAPNFWFFNCCNSAPECL